MKTGMAEDNKKEDLVQEIKEDTDQEKGNIIQEIRDTHPLVIRSNNLREER